MTSERLRREVEEARASTGDSKDVRDSLIMVAAVAAAECGDVEDVIGCPCCKLRRAVRATGNEVAIDYMECFLPQPPPTAASASSEPLAREGEGVADALVSMGAALHDADAEIARLREALGRITGMETISEARGVAAAVLLDSPSASSSSVPAEDVRELAELLDAVTKAGDDYRAGLHEAANRLRALLARHGTPAAKEPAR